MISSQRSDAHLMIVASPNCSADWRTNQYVLLLLAVPSLGGATALALMGAWPILPLAGLEMLALGSALYYANWKLQARQVITLGPSSVCIEKGHYAPSSRWEFAREGAALAVTPERHPWEGPQLALHNEAERVPIGEFLNRDDALSLLALLRRELAIRTFSPESKLLL